MKNYYRILNVRTSASEDEIKLSFRALAKRYHPDVNPDNAEAAKRFSDINEAYNVLVDPQKRAEYDALLWQALNTRRTPGGTRGASQQITAQIQAQIREQVAMQLGAVRERAYNEGYDRGRAEGRAQAAGEMGAETEKTKRSLQEVRRDRIDLEEELFERDRELARANDRIKELNEQLDWLRKVSYGGSALPTDLLRETLDRTKSRIDEIAEQLATVTKADLRANASQAVSTPMQIKTRADEIAGHIGELNKRISVVADEVIDVCTRYEQYRLSDENIRALSTMEERAKAWAQKQRNDHKEAKGTLYATLGVLIWATDSEIDEAFEALEKRYKGNAKGNAEKMEKIRKAYSILVEPVGRKHYNTSIGITDERIAEERRLIEENKRIQDEYRSKLAARDFWARFDELSSLALAGDADAQNLLGELYYHGTNIDLDYVQAVYWFREAFAQKHPGAIYNLGVCYINGEGVGRNGSIGYSLLRQAANLGYTPKPSNDL